MAINTQVEADRNAPPITQILAEFVANHPSAGWSDEVDHEAHRTFLNWLGCAVGAANHESVQAALAAIQEFAPAEQATILGRAERVEAVHLQIGHFDGRQQRQLLDARALWQRLSDEFPGRNAPGRCLQSLALPEPRRRRGRGD
jgi:hypothetical protein